MDRALSKDPIFGAPILNELLALVQNSQHCQVWHLPGPVFVKSAEDKTWDGDMLLYILCVLAAKNLVWQKAVEWWYFKGPGACGKDVIIMLLSFFLGDRSDDGYLTILPSDGYCRRGRQSPLAWTPSWTRQRMLAP